MNSMRKFLSLSMAALLLTAFALPATAGNDKKQFSLDMEIAPPTQTLAPFTLTATVKNEGNSTINSFILFPTNLTVVGVNQPSTGNATFTGSSVSVKNMHPLKSGDSLTVTLFVSSCGDGAWTGTAWTGSSLNGQTFDLVGGHSSLATSISCGSLGKGDTFAVPDALNPNCITGERGYYDKNGTIPGGPLTYFVTNTVPTNGQVHFRWDQSIAGDPAAAFDYSVCASGNLPLAQPTLVAWLNQDGSLSSQPGSPAFVPAQQCLQPSLPAPPLASMLPAPYGVLVSVTDLTADSAKLTVDALQLTGAHGAIQHGIPPFDIVIGTERMTVTDVSSDEGQLGDLSDSGDFEENEVELETWTVTRHVGGTPSINLSLPVQPNTLVMYTPLPLLPALPSTVACFTVDGVPLNASKCHYVAGNQAQMCVVEQVNSGTGHITELIDIGDGFSRP